MFWTGHFPYEMPAFQNMIFIFKNVAVAQGILMILGVQIRVLETLLYKAGLHRSQRTNPRRDRAGGGRLPARAAADSTARAVADSPRGQRPTPRAGSGRLTARAAADALRLPVVSRPPAYWTDTWLRCVLCSTKLLSIGNSCIFVSEYALAILFQNQ